MIYSRARTERGVESQYQAPHAQIKDVTYRMVTAPDEYERDRLAAQLADLHNSSKPIIGSWALPQNRP